jgi:hypothetical protein
MDVVTTNVVESPPMNVVAPSNEPHPTNAVEPGDDTETSEIVVLNDSSEDMDSSEDTDNTDSDDSADPNDPDFREFGEFKLVPHHSQFRELYNHRKSMDVILRSDGNPDNDLLAHKCVLASQSEYFDVIFPTIMHFRFFR